MLMVDGLLELPSIHHVTHEDPSSCVGWASPIRGEVIDEIPTCSPLAAHEIGHGTLLQLIYIDQCH